MQANITTEGMKKYSITPLVLLASLLFFPGCNHQHGEEGHHHEDELHQPADGEKDHQHPHHHDIVINPEHARQAGIVSQVITPSPFYQIVPVSGQVTAAQGEEQTLVATVSGVVRFNRSLTEGTSIAKGTPLFTISAHQMAEGDPAERARINYEAAKKEFERVEELIADKIVSGKEYNRIKEAYETARLNYEALVANQADAGGVTLTAPISGYIKSTLVHEGDFVTAGQPLAAISRCNRLYLRADVPERHYAAMSSIRSAHFKTSYNDSVYSTTELHGRLLSYGRSSGDKGYYIPVTFEIDNAAGLIPGAFAEVWLQAASRPDVLSVPVQALTEEQGVCYLYIQQDEEGYTRREVKTGGCDGRNIEIISGIHPGERVVVSGAYQVRLASVSKAIPGHSHEH